MLSLLLALLLAAPPAVAPSSIAFGRPVEVRILPKEATQEAVQKALAEIAEVEKLTDGLAALNAAAGKGPQPVDPRLLTVLTRARDFCVWSENAHGPLGRDLYGFWDDPSEPPSPEQAGQAVDLARCERLVLDPKNGTAMLAEGSGLDLRGFAEGFAVDRAVEVLKKEGVANAFVRIGPIQRGIGAGPAGKGWPVEVPPLDRIYLRDRSLAVVSESLFLNQRTGRRAQGVLAIAAVTDLAVDAQGLAATLFITGPREGQLRLGSLRPRPSARWFLGSGVGEPLRVDYRWSEVTRK